jgi:hypothetical protein
MQLFQLSATKLTMEKQKKIMSHVVSYYVFITMYFWNPCDIRMAKTLSYLKDICRECVSLEHKRRVLFKCAYRLVTHVICSSSPVSPFAVALFLPFYSRTCFQSCCLSSLKQLESAVALHGSRIFVTVSWYTRPATEWLIRVPTLSYIAEYFVIFTV